MNELLLSKKKQLAYKQKRKNPKVTISESALQKQCDDTLDGYRIIYLRIPNWVWKWLKQNAPVSLMNYMSTRFAGMPDSIAIKPLKGKYNLALCLELKTEKGRLHGKQKRWAKELNVQISRSPEDTIKEIEEFYYTEDK